MAIVRSPGSRGLEKLPVNYSCGLRRKTPPIKLCGRLRRLRFTSCMHDDGEVCGQRQRPCPCRYTRRWKRGLCSGLARPHRCASLVLNGDDECCWSSMNAVRLAWTSGKRRNSELEQTYTLKISIQTLIFLERRCYILEPGYIGICAWIFLLDDSFLSLEYTKCLFILNKADSIYKILNRVLLSC
jgi:hypothetical protein